MRRLKIELDCGRVITVQPPTVRQYYKQRAGIKTDDELFEFIAEVYSRNDEGVSFTADDVLDCFTKDDLDGFTSCYLKWLQEEKGSDPN